MSIKSSTLSSPTATNKPLLIIVTGRPASGKTTLTHILSREMKYPFLSRDELKEGYIHTVGIEERNLDHSADLHIYEAFFDAIGLFVSKGISVIVEAAFQHKLWKPKLLNLSDKAEIKIIICKSSTDLIKTRFMDRLLKDPDRDKFHGDKSLDPEEEGNLLTGIYEPVNISAPTLEVDTTEHYHPDIQHIIGFINQKSRL